MCSYFGGCLADGTQNIRLVGCDDEQKKKLTAAYNKQEAVTLSNCEIKPSHQSTEMKVMVRKLTSIEQSPKKFDITGVHVLGQIDHMDNFETVTVSVKAHRVENTVAIGGDAKKMKQDVMIADITGTAKLVLWKDDIGKITDGEAINYLE